MSSYGLYSMCDLWKDTQCLFFYFAGVFLLSRHIMLTCQFQWNLGVLINNAWIGLINVMTSPNVSIKCNRNNGQK